MATRVVPIREAIIRSIALDTSFKGAEEKVCLGRYNRGVAGEGAAGKVAFDCHYSV